MTPGSVRRCGSAFVAAGILSSSALCATAALADVTISPDATQGMSCSGRVCAPTATSAVLNVGDLQSLLASGNVTVTTTGSGVQADNIDVTAKLGWSANALTLDAYQSLSVTAPITVKGKSGLAILTNDGGGGGELAFSGKGHVTFKKLSGSLSINRTAYTLENSIAGLAAAIQKNPSGDYALAANFDASGERYSDSPIKTVFAGLFEGLGNAISNLAIQSPSAPNDYGIGLFTAVAEGATVSNIGVRNAKLTIQKSREGFWEGALVGLNEGTLFRSFATGKIDGPKGSYVGGLVGNNNIGTIEQCHANVSASGPRSTTRVGGLVGENGGTISESYAMGNVDGAFSSGALVGINDGSISNSYATRDASTYGGGANAGGLERIPFVLNR